MFTNPAAVFDQVRAPILGIDTKNPGTGPISSLPYWNMDVSLSKSVRVASRATVELYVISTNVLNHLDFTNTESGTQQHRDTGASSTPKAKRAPEHAVRRPHPLLTNHNHQLEGPEAFASGLSFACWMFALRDFVGPWLWKLRSLLDGGAC